MTGEAPGAGLVSLPDPGLDVVASEKASQNVADVASTRRMIGPASNNGSATYTSLSSCGVNIRAQVAMQYCRAAANG